MADKPDPQPPKKTQDIKDTRTPNIPLNGDVIEKLQNMVDNYIKVLRTLAKQVNENIPKNPALQHAIIFLLKAIGASIDKATTLLGKNIDEMPLFWRNLHYLRNTLVHHLYAINLPTESITFFKDICRKNGQILFYFQLVINAQNTAVDFRNPVSGELEKYKVFLDIEELIKTLRTAFPRENRATTPQSDYLQIILNAIDEIKTLTTNITINEAAIKTMRNEDSLTYCALQNLLELVAEITNPNAQPCLLNTHTIKTINDIVPDAAQYLRDLGSSRNSLMHNMITMDNGEMAMHLQNMIQLEQGLNKVIAILRANPAHAKINPVSASNATATATTLAQNLPPTTNTSSHQTSSSNTATSITTSNALLTYAAIAKPPTPSIAKQNTSSITNTASQHQVPLSVNTPGATNSSSSSYASIAKTLPNANPLPTATPKNPPTAAPKKHDIAAAKGPPPKQPPKTNNMPAQNTTQKESQSSNTNISFGKKGK